MWLLVLLLVQLPPRVHGSMDVNCVHSAMLDLGRALQQPCRQAVPSLGPAQGLPLGPPRRGEATTSRGGCRV